MKNQKFEICPRCESKKVNEITKAKGVFIGFCILGISVWFLIIPPVGILGMLFGLVFIPVSMCYYPRFVCMDCKYSWKPEDDNGENQK